MTNHPASPNCASYGRIMLISPLLYHHMTIKDCSLIFDLKQVNRVPFGQTGSEWASAPSPPGVAKAYAMITIAGYDGGTWRELARLNMPVSGARPGGNQ